MGYLLLTGCTGLLGRYLLRDLLAARVGVAVLVRPDKMSSARQRVESVMGHWECQAGRSLPRPVVLRGELTASGLGLAPGPRRWLQRRCTRVLHCAASMTFREDKRGEPYRTNVDGTRELLGFCRDAGIEEMHYVSTAFICGLREGRVLESEQDVGQRLGNVYERSKLLAEQLVTQADFLSDVTIYRPSTVVGDSQTGYVTSYHGFYLALQLAYIMADKIPVEAMDQRFFSRLGLNGEERKNLVPVDWLSRSICYLVTHPAYHGRTYHLASATPVKVRTIQHAIRDAIQRYSNRSPAQAMSETNLEALEDLFCQHMSIYQSHWRADPVFDLGNTNEALGHMPCPEMTPSTLLRVARYPVEQGFALRRSPGQRSDFDVSRHLRECVAAAHPLGRPTLVDQRIGLQINGTGGGQWEVEFRGGRVTSVEDGIPQSCATRVYLNASTFRLVANGKLTLEQSMNMGKVVVEGAAQDLGEVTRALQAMMGRT